MAELTEAAFLLLPMGCGFVNDAPCSRAEVGVATSLVFQDFDIKGTFNNIRSCWWLTNGGGEDVGLKGLEMAMSGFQIIWGGLLSWRR